MQDPIEGKRARGNDSPDLWTIVTVSYNSAQKLREHWPANTSSFPARWIVVDNGSTDDSVATAQALGAEVLPLAYNRGFAAANNAGLTEVITPYVAFVNPDVNLTHTDFNLLAQQCALDALVAPRLTNPDGSLQANARGLPTVTSKVRNRVPPRPKVGHRYLPFTAAGSVTAPHWITGAFITAKTEVFRELGEWDEAFFLYNEDTELSFRWRQSGRSVLVDERTTAVHDWAREATGANIAAWRREFRSLRTLLSRYPYLLMPYRLASIADQRRLAATPQQFERTPKDND